MLLQIGNLHDTTLSQRQGSAKIDSTTASKPSTSKGDPTFAQHIWSASLLAGTLIIVFIIFNLRSRAQ